MPDYTLRQKIGCLLFDLPRLLPALVHGNRWQEAWNRREPLCVEHGGVDTTPIGPFSTDLYTAHVFPWVGSRLLRLAFAQWPVRLAASPAAVERTPDVSFVIPHRGIARLPQLQATVASILGQDEVAVECIVVEQDAQPRLSGLPDAVRVVHLPHPTDPEGWRKSWAFNVGVKEAKAGFVVCHDGDMPVPRAYGREVLRRLGSGKHDVCHLQRFLFCLGRPDSEAFAAAGELPRSACPERVRQNWQGGTVAITKEAFARIGGYDESFVDWGGEDCEFFDRCRLLRAFRHGYLPFIHLWHPPQPSKQDASRDLNLRHMQQLLAIPAAERVQRLRQDAAVSQTEGSP